MNYSSTKSLNYPSPCPHCGKENKNKWCYEYTSESGVLYGVCKREAEPAQGWEPTEYSDKDGTRKYRMIRERFVKQVRPKASRSWTYHDTNGKPLVLVKREDDGSGDPKYSQWHYSKSGELSRGLGPVKSETIPVYGYDSVRKAIERGHTIWIVEGESCADALNGLFSSGGHFATTNIGGSGKWKDLNTENLTGANRVIICPDRDVPGKKHGEKVADHLRRAGIPFSWCFPDPTNWEWQDLPPKKGFDVADWLKDKTNDLDKLIDSVTDRPIWDKPSKPAIDFEERKLSRDFDLRPDQGSESLLRLDVRELYQFVKSTFGSRLRFNEMTREVELDGEEYDLDNAYLELGIHHGIKASKGLALDMFMLVAKENSWHPVRLYLEKVANHIRPISLDNLAERYLGTKNPLYNIFLKKTLIAAVARIFEPGCQVDTALVLQGKTGVRKSSFFKYLTGREWFNDDFKAGDTKDELLKLHRNWIIEWSEIESVFNKKKSGEIKAFITCTSDCFREPYGRKTANHPRHQILVGTTNEGEFLSDPTGNRRYWVIPVAVDRIDTDLLTQERNAIWSAAVEAYRAGEKWYLTDEEEQLAKENNEHFLESDVWEDVILEWLSGREETPVTIRAILSEALNIDISMQDKRVQGRVARCLTKNGWERKIVGKTRQRVWVKPLSSTDERVIVPIEKSDNHRVDHRVDHQVDHPQNGHGERVSGMGDPPDPLKSGNLEKNTSDNFSSPQTKEIPTPKSDRLEVGDRVEYEDVFQNLVKQSEVVDITEGATNTGEPFFLYRLANGGLYPAESVKFIGKKPKWYELNGNGLKVKNP